MFLRINKVAVCCTKVFLICPSNSPVSEPEVHIPRSLSYLSADPKTPDLTLDLVVTSLQILIIFLLSLGSRDWAIITWENTAINFSPVKKICQLADHTSWNLLIRKPFLVQRPGPTLPRSLLNVSLIVISLFYRSQGWWFAVPGWWFADEL